MITEFGRSTIITHADDGDPVTMLMRGTVADDSQQWNTSLTRELVDFDWQWTASLVDPALDDRDERIARIANLMDGPFPGFLEPDEVAEHFRPVASFSQLPPEVQDTVERWLEDNDNLLMQKVDEGTVPHELVDEGEVVGFMVDTASNRPFWSATPCT